MCRPSGDDDGGSSDDGSDAISNGDASNMNVRVDCRLVGIPGLSGAAENQTFEKLTSTFALDGRHKFHALTTPSMQSIIEYKWHTFAKAEWKCLAVAMSAYSACFLVGCMSYGMIPLRKVFSLVGAARMRGLDPSRHDIVEMG